MYINNKFASEYAAIVTERILNYNVMREPSFETLGGAYRSQMAGKTWPEVIRLYRGLKRK